MWSPALGDRTDTFIDSFRRDREDYPNVRTATVLGSVDQSLIDAHRRQVGPVRGLVRHRLVPGRERPALGPDEAR